MTNISSNGGNYVAKNKLLLPHGAVGEFIKEINEKLLHIKSEHVATIAAFLTVSSLCARYYLTPFELSPNLYAFVIGSSGSGKDGVQKALDKICLQLSNYMNFDGDVVRSYCELKSISSSQTIYSLLSTNNKNRNSTARPNALLFFSQEGSKILNPKTRPENELRNLLISMFSCDNSFSLTDKYKDKEGKIGSIFRPIISMYCDMTTGTFRDCISKTGSDGIVSRALLIQVPTQDYVEKVRGKDKSAKQMNVRFLETLKNILEQSENGFHNEEFWEIGMSVEAEELYNDFGSECSNKRKSLQPDSLEDASYVRLQDYALRIATLIASYNAHASNKQAMLDSDFGGVSAEDMAYGIYYVSYYHNAFLADLHAGNINEGDSSKVKQLDMLLDEYTNMTENEAIALCNTSYGNKFDLDHWRDGIISHSLIIAKLINKTIFSKSPIGASDAIGKTINSLVDCGRLTPVTPNGKRGKFYQIK